MHAENRYVPYKISILPTLKPLIKMQVNAIMKTSAIANFPMNWRVDFTCSERSLNWISDKPIVFTKGAKSAKNVTINARYLSSDQSVWIAEIIVTSVKPNKSGSFSPSISIDIS